MEVPPGELLSAVSERVVMLADEYADRLIQAMSAAVSEEQLREGVSGAFISFLSDILGG